MEQSQLPPRPPRRSDRATPDTPPCQPQTQPAQEETWAEVQARAVSQVSRMAAGMRPVQAPQHNTAPDPQPREAAPLRRAAPQLQPAADRRAVPQPAQRQASQPARQQERSARSPMDEPISRSTRRTGDMLQSGPATAKDIQREKRSERLPGWITVSIVICILGIMACAAGELLMTGWLRQQQDAREAAHRAVVNAHPLQYRDLIEQYAAQYNLQPAFVASIILNESSYNSRAQSGVGARGLMQLMPDTAEWIAHKLGMDSGWTADKLWDPETNIRFGCWYLRYLNSLFGGDPVTVTSAYHTGQGQVSTWLGNTAYAPDGRALRLDTMPEGPTKVYAGRVTRDYGIYDALYFHVFNQPQADDPA